MRALRRGLVLVALAGAAAAAAERTAAPEAPALLLGRRFPLEVGVAFPAALVHWLDSLAGLDGPGLTSGKTRPAHLAEYRRTLGQPTRADVERLRGYARARTAAADPHALTAAFFEAATLDEALARARGLLDGEHAAALEDAVREFAPRYQAIWRDGQEVRAFLARVAQDGRRDELARFLAGVARFFGVPVPHDAPPRLLLAPVPEGFGTHAQALGRQLLIEIRPGEGLTDQVAPIVHEVAHFLFQRIEPARLAAFERALAGAGPTAPAAARALLEALPTAVAQGVADRRFRPRRWSPDGPWYHLDEIDAYAKRLYPLVRERLARVEPLDDAFLVRAVALYDLSRR